MPELRRRRHEHDAVALPHLFQNDAGGAKELLVRLSNRDSAIVHLLLIGFCILGPGF